MTAIAINTEAVVRVSSFGLSTRQKGHWHSGAVIEDNVFILVLEGRLNVRVEEQSHRLNSNDFIIIPANTFYKPMKAEGLRYCFVRFAAENGEYALPFKGSFSGRDDVIPLIEDMCRLNIHTSASDSMIMNAKMLELLIKTADERSALVNCSASFFEILEYVNENFKDDIGLTELSRRHGISGSYIARCFKDILSTDSSEYTNRLKVAQACKMILSTDMKMCDVAISSGFNNPFYFSRTFKSICGITPEEFKKTKKC